MVYEGLRYRVQGQLAGKVYGFPFGLDVGFGDVLTEPPEMIDGSDFLAFVGVQRARHRVYPCVVHIAETVELVVGPSTPFTASARAWWAARRDRGSATPFGQGPQVMIRDRDDKFGADFDRVAKGAGIRVLRTAVRAHPVFGQHGIVCGELVKSSVKTVARASLGPLICHSNDE